MLPPAGGEGKEVTIGPETFTVYCNEEGQISKITIEVLEEGKLAGPPGFYVSVGGTMPPPPGAAGAEPEAEPDIVAVTKEMLDMQISMAKGEVDPAMMESFSVKMMGYFADEISWSTPTTGDSKGNFMDMMGTVGPIWMGFVNTEAVNLDCVKESDAVASMTQKYVNYLAIDGTKIEGTDRTIEVKHSLT
jgi:hypothetical protein